jgi:hypothetical protein
MSDGQKFGVMDAMGWILKITGFTIAIGSMADVLSPMAPFAKIFLIIGAAVFLLAGGYGLFPYIVKAAARPPMHLKAVHISIVSAVFCMSMSAVWGASSSYEQEGGFLASKFKGIRDLQQVLMPGIEQITQKTSEIAANQDTLKAQMTKLIERIGTNGNGWTLDTTRFAAGASSVYSAISKDDSGTYRVLANWSRGWMEFEAIVTERDSLPPSVLLAQAKALAYSRAGALLRTQLAMQMPNDSVQLQDSSRLSRRIADWVSAAEVREENISPASSGHGLSARVMLGVLLDTPSQEGSFLEFVADNAARESEAAGYSQFTADASSGSKASEQWTGVIFDASGFQVQPVFAPTILVEGKQHRVLYSGSTVIRDYAVEIGIAGYAKTVDQARRDTRIAVNGRVSPMVVRVSSVEGDTLFVDVDEAAKVAAANVKDRFLDQCRVVIVVG